MAHFAVGKRDLRDEFAFLGMVCLIGGFTGLIMLLLAAAVFTFRIIAETVVTLFNN